VFVSRLSESTVEVRSCMRLFLSRSLAYTRDTDLSLRGGILALERG